MLSVLLEAGHATTEFSARQGVRTDRKGALLFSHSSSSSLGCLIIKIISIIPNALRSEYVRRHLYELYLFCVIL